MEKSSFFNSIAGDRVYQASDFANFFNSFITNGIFPDPSTNLQVMTNNDMTVTILAGKAWINGYVYINDADLILPIDAADGVLQRIDRIAVRFDTVGRLIFAEVIKGSPASSPVAADLQRDADGYELGLADVLVGAGAVDIAQGDITDQRLDTDLCGLVNSLIQADTTTLLNQYEAEFAGKEVEFEDAFNTWFTDVKAVLGGDVAANLLVKIDDNTAALVAHSADGTKHSKVARFVIGTSTSGWTSAQVDYLCDGTADQAEINAAITALPATGGEIVILDGTYNITAKISVNKSNVTLSGNGNATILKRMWSSTVNEGVITVETGLSYCKIKDFYIDGNKATFASSNNYSIYVITGSNNIITNNRCDNGYEGIKISNGSYNIVTDNICNTNNNMGIEISNSNNNIVNGNLCNNNAFNGIFVAYGNSNYNIIGNNECCLNTNIGINLTNTCVGNTSNGNNCNGNLNSGIGLQGVSNNNISGNVCNNNTVNGILLWNSGVDKNNISSNTCINNAVGISLANGNNNNVSGNSCIRGTGLTTDYTASQYTINLSGTANNYNLISSNNCMGKDVVIGGGTSNTSVNNKFA